MKSGLTRVLRGSTSPSLARFVFFLLNSKLKIDLTTVRAPLIRQNVRWLQR